MDGDNQDKVAQFSAITGANPSTAQATLESANWDLEEAVGLYFAAADDPQADHDADMGGNEDEIAETMRQSDQSGPSQQATSTAKSGQKPPGKRPMAMTLRDLQGSGDGDEDDEDDEKPRDLFAGGEKSALAVQDPSNQGGPMDHFRNIMNQARQNRSRPGDEEDESPAGGANFRGPAQTLGGDDAPSRAVGEPAATAPSRQRLQRVTRTLHLWSDGVSIDDGPLFRFDDPANADMMAQINQGRAPLSLLDVQPDQEVDLNLDPHKDEKYVKPRSQYKPFGGSGQRLGAPTPGPAPSSSTATSSQPVAAAPASSPQKADEVAVDQSAPIVQLQIRLGDGTQLRSRFNTTHTIGDVYEFVNRASSASTQRPYALMTTFPSRELSDKAQVLGDMADFKRGGVVVQKWT
ncbi:protein phosphatase regulator [Teratosphaeriaceae sp. CCFEE 6253]|nr:protein phosphatase regulator [Teratosphaeriaceae sp. CCFEE 6253]